MSSLLTYGPTHGFHTGPISCVNSEDIHPVNVIISHSSHPLSLFSLSSSPPCLPNKPQALGVPTSFTCYPRIYFSIRYTQIPFALLCSIQTSTIPTFPILKLTTFSLIILYLGFSTKKTHLLNHTKVIKVSFSPFFFFRISELLLKFHYDLFKI
jgi:hypothetical protein